MTRADGGRLLIRQRSCVPCEGQLLDAESTSVQAIGASWMREIRRPGEGDCPGQGGGGDVPARREHHRESDKTKKYVP